MKNFKKLIAIVLSVAILFTTLVISGAVASDVIADNDFTNIESELLSETFVFDFDKVRNYAVNSDYAIDKEGNAFYPVHSASAKTSVKQKNFVVDGETVTTAEVSAGGKTVFIPTDENGQPFIIEPNTKYTVKIKFYTMAATAHGLFCMGGGTLGSNEQACKTSAMEKNIYLWEEGKNKYTYTSGWNPFYRCTGENWAETARYFPEVKFQTKTNTFRTLDFATEGGMFKQSTYKNTGTSDAPVYVSNEEYYDFGKYFGIFFSAGNVNVDGYNGNATYYIDEIEITANRSRTLEVGESYTFNFSEGEVIDTTVNSTKLTDGDGNTFYPLHASSATGTKAAQENITVKLDDKGNTQTVGTLKFVNNGKTSYIPTDANGMPFVIEPNTKYKVDIVSYAQYVGSEGQFFTGGGAYEASKQTYKPLDSYYNNNKSWYYVNGTNKGNPSPDMYAAYPMFRAASSNYANAVNRNLYASSDPTKTTKLRYYEDFVKGRSGQHCSETVYFSTSDYEEIVNEKGVGTNSFNTDLWKKYYYVNGDGKALGITDPYSDLAKENGVVIENKNIGTYFCIYGEGATVTAYYDDGSGNRVAKPTEYTTFYIDSIKITKLSTTDTADVTLDANGGTFEEGTTLDASLAVGGDFASATLPTNADTTLSFAGWSTHREGDPVSKVTPAMDGNTLYAIWKPAVANVTFDANGGKLADGSATKTTTQYKDLKFTEANPTRDGYIFKGWGKSADATTPVVTATADLANTTLYALWAPDPIMVYFNANGGKFADGSFEILSEQLVGGSVSVETPVYGYNKLLGWSTDMNGTDTVTEITKEMEDGVLYAVWKFCHPVDGKYDSWARTIEFDEYKVVADVNTFLPAAETYKPYQNVLYFKTIDDPDEAGDKYLHYYNHSGAGAWAANWTITPTPNGVTNTNSDAESGQVLPTGSTFKMTYRVRINSTGGGSPSISMFYGTSNGRNSITDNTSKTATVNLKTGLTASENWQTITVYFTTPDEYPVMSNSGKVANRFYTGLLCAGYKMDYDLDYIKIEKVTNVNLYVKNDGKYVLKDTVTGVPGEALNLPPYYSEESYSLYDPTGSAAKMVYGNWYSDEACITAPILKFGNFDVDLYCSSVTEIPAVNTKNQDIFVGFDTYTQRTNGIVNAVVTDEAYNTGSSSLKANVSANAPAFFELKNDHTLDVLNGKTYRIDFSYKADKNSYIDFGLANGVVDGGITSKCSVDLKAADDWTSASAIITADGALDNSVLAAKVSSTVDAIVFIDTIIVSSVTESVGVEAETTDDGEALRFMLSYGGETFEMAGNDYTVAEHGVLVKGEELDTELSLENADKSGIFAFSQTDLTKNWSVNPITGTTVYSAYLEGFDKADDYKVSVRGYVKLNDGTVYYSDVLTASITDIPAAKDIIPENADLSGYYVYLPEGTTLPAERDYTVTTYNDLFVANNAEKDNVITVGSYVIFSARPDFNKIDVPSEQKFMVHAGTKDELYYGIEAQIVSEKISSVGKDTVNYLFITDIHYGSSLTTAQEVTLRKETALMAKMANENDDIDFVVVGGDTTTGMYGSKEQCVTWTQAALDPLLECEKPVFVLMGNHDDNSYHIAAGNKELYVNRVITDLDWQNYIIDRYTNKGNITVVQDDPAKRQNSKYYYYDLEGKKTRVIALDALDYEAKYDENGFVLEDLNGDGLYDGMPVKNANGATDNATYHSGYSYWGYSADQIRWLAEDALGDLPADYDVVFISHMGMDKTTNSYGSKIWFGENIREIIKTFNAGGTYTAPSPITGVTQYPLTQALPVRVETSSPGSSVISTLSFLSTKATLTSGRSAHPPQALPSRELRPTINSLQAMPTERTSHGEYTLEN